MDDPSHTLGLYLLDGLQLQPGFLSTLHWPPSLLVTTLDLFTRTGETQLSPYFLATHEPPKMVAGSTVPYWLVSLEKNFVFGKEEVKLFFHGFHAHLYRKSNGFYKEATRTNE